MAFIHAVSEDIRRDNIHQKGVDAWGELRELLARIEKNYEKVL
jgi:hypothetical protein